MATEYRLSYTASEIDEKLGQIDDLAAETINKQQGETNIGKVLVVGEDGNITLPSETFDETLLPVEPLVRKNLLDKNAAVKSSFYDPNTGYENFYGEVYNPPESNPYIQNYVRTDFIPVDGGNKYVFSGNAYIGDTGAQQMQCYLHSYCYFTADKTFISGKTITSWADYHIFDVPSDAAYIIINEVKYDRLLNSKAQFEKGEVPTAYEKYITDIYDIPTTGAAGKNLLDKNAITCESYCSYLTGAFEFYPDNSYIQAYCRTDFMPVEGGAKYVFSGNKYDNETESRLQSYCYFDAEKNFVSGALASSAKAEYHVLDIPVGVSYVILNSASSARTQQGKPQFEKGEVPTEYEEYIPIIPLKGAKKFYLPSLKIRATQIEDLGDIGTTTKSEVKLQLPYKYSLVVGDTFELFYKGIINAVNTDIYYVEIKCQIGQVFSKRYICTPTAVGDYTMSVKLYDNSHNLLDTKTVILSVKNKAVSPSDEVVVLYVGDSLASGGYVPNEFKRRLTATNGTPNGDGLNNISFIGTCRSADGAVDYEGYGGYKFSTYLNESKNSGFMWITASSHDKTDDDQHSTYTASNGSTWKLETIETTKIKLIRLSGSELPSTGTLTWTSGGVNHANIVYTASEQAAGNPFWDTTKGKNDFASYAQNLGKSKIDYVYVLLGWNDANGADETTYKNQVKQFLSSVWESFPECKIVLLGVQVPARDGLGANYSPNSFWVRYHDVMQFTFTLNKWYTDIAAEYSNKVSFVNIAGQFDTEHNHLTAERQVNVRNEEKEVYQSNGLHPAKTGYKQIADACYRDFVHKLQS